MKEGFKRQTMTGGEDQSKDATVSSSSAERDQLIQKIEEFFDKNRRWLDLYSGDGNFEIEDGSKVGLDTFAIDLEKRKMYYHPRFYAEEGFKPPHALFATLHELEHLRELVSALERKGGSLAWKRNIAKIEKSKPYSILDNCFDDIKMNMTVGKRAPVLSGVPKEVYKEKLFKEDDMTSLPKHLQFSYALVRDANIGEDSILSEDVRAEIEKLKNFKLPSGKEINLVDFFSRPETKMEERIAFQEQYLEPIMQSFLEEDKQNPKFDDKKNGEEVGDKSEKSPEGKKSGKKGKDKGDGNEQEGKSEPSGEDSPPKVPARPSGGDQPPVEKKGGGTPKENIKPSENPDAKFKKYYEEFDKLNKKPKEISEEELVKKVEEYLKTRKPEKSPEDIANEEYARKNGVDFEDFKKYQKFKKTEIDTILDKKTGQRAIDELREQIKRIASERKKKEDAPRYPVEEGERLALPVDAYIAVQDGNFKPKVWETTETREKIKKRFSNFDLYLVADTSGSMSEDGAKKLLEQRKADVLVLEAMKELYEEIELESDQLEEPLSIRTACYTFGSGVKEVKKLGENLTEKDRVKMYKELNSNSGSTQDFLALEKINADMDKMTEQEIKEGKRKSLIIVTTDGVSDDAERLKLATEELKKKGVIIYGVGIASSGVLNSYGKNGIVADSADEIPSIYKKILDRELSDL